MTGHLLQTGLSSDGVKDFSVCIAHRPINTVFLKPLDFVLNRHFFSRVIDLWGVQAIRKLNPSDAFEAATDGSWNMFHLFTNVTPWRMEKIIGMITIKCIY